MSLIMALISSVLSTCCLTQSTVHCNFQTYSKHPIPQWFHERKTATFHHYYVPSRECTKELFCEKLLRNDCDTAGNSEATTTQRICHDLCSKKTCSMTSRKYFERIYIKQPLLVTQKKKKLKPFVLAFTSKNSQQKKLPFLNARALVLNFSHYMQQQCNACRTIQTFHQS